MIKTVLCEMLDIVHPVFQGGMAWISDGKLAAAVSNAGGLGIIAAGNAPAGYVRQQIRLAKSLTDKPFGVNIMLGAAGAAEAIVCIQVLSEAKIPPTINLIEPDPECDLNYIPHKTVNASIDLAVSNSFGFGGHNACLAFRKV